MLFPFGFAPRGWALCKGQLLPINQNQALFSLLGVTYGGDGRTNFALPDPQGRTPVSIGNGIVLGQKAGTETHTLTLAEVAAHNHPVNGTTGPANSGGGSLGLLALTPTGAIYKKNSTNINAPLNPATVGSFGNSQPHENRPPYLVMNWCIALTGIYPTRN